MDNRDFSLVLGSFFKGIEHDQRISSTHIGIFTALLHYWQTHEFKQPLQVYSHEIMELAKISTSNTYHKCIRALNEYGYIIYEPSYKRNQASKFFFVKSQEDAIT